MDKFIACKTNGNSMLPWIREGDIVFFYPIKWEEIRPGDIIVYKSREGGLWVAHRVLKKGKSKVMTKGDAFVSWRAKEEVPKDKIVGKVFLIKRGGRLYNIRWTKIVYYLNRYFPPLWWIFLVAYKYRNKNPLLLFERLVERSRRLLFTK